jgi:two-component system cell cycle sensor histidine kinase/response regulator CckA
LEVTIVPLASGASGAPHLCVLAEDISARKLMDAEIAQSRRLRAVGELVGGIAHEFNNLLTPVMLKVGEIQLDWSSDTRLQHEMGVIAQAAKRAAELTRRLLTFGRKSEARAEPVRFNTVVANCFDLLRHTVDRRIVWESDLPDDLPPLLFNATDLNQVLLNLLLNSRDTLLEKLTSSSNPGWTPRIRVIAAELPPATLAPPKPRPGAALLGWQRITVQDNGLGMPANVVERIFEPFFTTKDVGKGTGLGLATVWHIVTESGGRVDVESTPGVGSAFHVLLPEWGCAAEPAAGKGGEPAKLAPVRRVRVLLVEDEELVAAAVTAMLQRGGHEVSHLPDGAAAWEHLSADLAAYDLLVIDVNLPGLNGVELVGRLRDKNYPGKIFVVSGRLGMADLRILVQLHVDRVLTKPFSLEQFETAVRECLAPETAPPAEK